MRLKVSELMGITTASVDLEPGKVVEVVGPNEAGKTSFAIAAQAVLARSANPFNLPVADIQKAYLRQGNKDGVASLYPDEGWEVHWWPGSGTIEAPTSGEGARALSQPEAVGLVDFTSRRGPAERAAVFQSVLLPDPSRVLNRLRDALKARLPARDLAGVVDTVQKRGWKAAATVYVERMRSSKRAWGAVTGKTYGVKAASDWRPDQWRAELDGMTTAEAEAKVAAARDALALLNREDAISEQEAQDARDAQDEIESATWTDDQNKVRLEEVLARRSELQSVHHSAISKRNRKRAEMPMKGLDKPRVVPCPHCEGALVVSLGLLAAFDQEAFDAEAAKIEGVRDKINKQVEALDVEVSKAEVNATAANRDYQEVAVARARTKARLDELKVKASRAAGVIANAERERALMQSEQDVEDRKRDVEMVRSTSAAGNAHRDVLSYNAISTAVGPGGIRAKMVEAKLAGLNKGLAVLTEAAGWPLVKVAVDGAITYRNEELAEPYKDRPLPLCSLSSQWRAQACLQLTIAAMTGSAAVVLDRADLLDAGNRQGLIKAVERVTTKRPIAVLLCSTGQPDENPPWKQVSVFRGEIKEG